MKSEKKETCIVRGLLLCYNTLEYIPMKNLKFAIISGFIGFILIFLTNTAHTDDRSAQADPENLKAAYIVKFPEFIEWPPHSTVSDPQSPFIIGVLGETPILSVLIEQTKKIKIVDKKVEIITISDYSQIKKCNALFISRFSRIELKKILEQVDRLPILTIGDTVDYEKRGVMINLFVSGRSVKFNVNWASAKKSGIILTSKIVRCAKFIVK